MQPRQRWPTASHRHRPTHRGTFCHAAAVDATATRLGKLRTTRVLISQYGMDEARYKMSQQPWMPAAPLDGAAIAQTYELPVFNQVKCAMRSFKNYMSSIIKLILEVPC